MFTRIQAQQIINDEIERLDLPKNPGLLYEPILYTLSLGGKRIRPVLTLLAYQLYSDNFSEVLPAALAIEVFHNFTLIHDDIMDNSDLRRGKPTVHKKWNNNVAILSGDAMNILAYKLLSRLNPSKLPLIIEIFNNTALKVCEGQQYDMDFETTDNISEQEYIKMIELKTAVLLAASLKIGALVGGANEKEANTLYQFGIDLGLAFQLQDDWLDTFGNEQIFGKKIGNDIVYNKKTYLLIKALQLANSDQKNKLLYWISARSFDRIKKINEVKQIFIDLNIDKLTTERIQMHVNNAYRHLESLPMEKAKKTELFGFINDLSQRSF